MCRSAIAVLFDDARLVRVVSWRANATAYAVSAVDGEVTERALVAETIG